MTSQVTRYASVLDTILDSAEVDLRFAFDTEHAGATSLEYWARFKTEAGEEPIGELMTLLEKGCHTTNTIRAAVPVIPHLRLNGQEIPYDPIGVSSDARSAHSNPEPLMIDASIRILDTYWREGMSEGFTVNADEASARGGTSKAPPPLRYFLMGTGFGIGTQAVRSAAQIGFQLDYFNLDVETTYDARGKMMLGDLYVGQLWYKYWLNLQSSEPPEHAVELVHHVERNCRTTNTLRQPVQLIPHVLVNGREINYTLPRQPAPETVRAEWGFGS